MAGEERDEERAGRPFLNCALIVADALEQNIANSKSQIRKLQMEMSQLKQQMEMQQQTMLMFSQTQLQILKQMQNLCGQMEAVEQTQVMQQLKRRIREVAEGTAFAEGADAEGTADAEGSHPLVGSPLATPPVFPDAQGSLPLVPPAGSLWAAHYPGTPAKRARLE